MNLGFRYFPSGQHRVLELRQGSCGGPGGVLGTPAASHGPRVCLKGSPLAGFPQCVACLTPGRI